MTYKLTKEQKVWLKKFQTDFPYHVVQPGTAEIIKKILIEVIYYENYDENVREQLNDIRSIYMRNKR